MARRGRDQITVRLEEDVLEELRPLAQGGRGRAGGLSFYLRRLIYQDLGWPLPEQYGLDAVPAWSPRLAVRLEHWLEADPDGREELREAADLLATRLGVELVEPGELQRLRREAGEAARLRRERAGRPTSAPVAAGEGFEEGRLKGLLEAREMAEDLIHTYRSEGYGDEISGLVEGLGIAARQAQSLAEEIQRSRERRAAEEVRGQAARGTRYADPSWLRSAARQWQLVLRDNPEDGKARETLEEIESLARAAGVEIPPLPPPRRRPSRRR